MNIKVVIVWGFAVIVFLAIGIFGYFNQDLLRGPSENSNTNPHENEIEYITKSCVGTNDSGNITYTFSVNPSTNIIERLNIRYQSVVENLDIYADAATINQKVNEKQYRGVTAQIYGTSKDVQLNLNINLLDYDKTNLDTMNQDLLKVGMFVDNIKDYNEYQSSITSRLNREFTCD